jgi:hypothetical protein
MEDKTRGGMAAARSFRVESAEYRLATHGSPF